MIPLGGSGGDQEMRMDWEERRVTVWDCGALGTVVVGGKGKRGAGEGRKSINGSCADMLAIWPPAAPATLGPRSFLSLAEVKTCTYCKAYKARPQ